MEKADNVAAPFRVQPVESAQANAQGNVQAKACGHGKDYNYGNV